MERAIITINDSGKVNIPDSNVWMSFSELVVLFDVAAPTLKATIRAIHKSEVIVEHSQHCEVMPYTYWATLYNMDMIVALAFRINSYGEIGDTHRQTQKRGYRCSHSACKRCQFSFRQR